MELPGLLDVDLLGRPRDAVHIDMDQSMPTSFSGEVIRDFNRTDITGGASSLEQALAAQGKSTSGKDRTRLELDISSTHIRFGMPDQNNWWIDRDVPALKWTQGVIQLGHHSYTPDKECDRANFPNAGLFACTGNTWHWSNVAVTPATPFGMLRPDNYLSSAPITHPEVSPSFLTFDQPAPEQSFLRFAAYGHVQYSLDQGRTWLTPAAQPTTSNPSGGYVDVVFMSYFVPIPAGTRRIDVRGRDTFAGWWMINDASIWSQQASG